MFSTEKFIVSTTEFSISPKGLLANSRLHLVEATGRLEESGHDRAVKKTLFVAKKRES